MVAGDLVILNKVRPAHNEAKVTTVIGDVEGKVAVIIDDIIDTAGTLVAGAKALKDAGATKVYACATHGLFNGQALERIAEQRDPQARRHRHGAARPARASPTTSRCSRSPASSPRRSRTCSPTTPCRRSSPARTSSSEPSRPRCGLDGVARTCVEASRGAPESVRRPHVVMAAAQR